MLDMTEPKTKNKQHRQKIRKSVESFKRNDGFQPRSPPFCVPATGCDPDSALYPFFFL